MQKETKGDSEHGNKGCCEEQKDSGKKLSKSLRKPENNQTEEEIDYLAYSSGGW